MSAVRKESDSLPVAKAWLAYLSNGRFKNSQNARINRFESPLDPGAD
jgi:hypothetical protein